MSRSAFLLAHVFALTTAAAVPTLYGLGLTHNAPSQASLLTADASTGTLSIVGFEPNASSAIELAATGDLCAVDTTRRMYYYLGDTERGATLVGLSLDDGTERCRSCQIASWVGKQPRSTHQAALSERPGDAHGGRRLLGREAAL